MIVYYLQLGHYNASWGSSVVGCYSSHEKVKLEMLAYLKSHQDRYPLDEVTLARNDIETYKGDKNLHVSLYNIINGIKLNTELYCQRFEVI